MSQGGNAAQVLNTAAIYFIEETVSGINRIPLPTGSTGTAAEQAVASGKVLTVGGSPLLPRWENNTQLLLFTTLTKEGDDANGGRKSLEHLLH